MKSIITQCIEVVALLTVLLTSLRVALKKGTLLAKDIKKASDSMAKLGLHLPHSTTALGQDEPLRQSIPEWEFAVALLTIATLLVLDIFDNSPLSRVDMVFIAMKVATMFSIILLYRATRSVGSFGRLLRALDRFIEAVRLYVETPKKEESDKALKPMTKSVTPPAAQESHQL